MKELVQHNKELEEEVKFQEVLLNELVRKVELLTKGQTAGKGDGSNANNRTSTADKRSVTAGAPGRGTAVAASRDSR